jgi:anti-sigma factor RsiW
VSSYPTPQSAEFDCTTSERALLDRLDGTPIAGLAALRQHLAVCAACRQLHAAAGRLEDGLRLHPRPVAPPGLTDRIVAAVLEDQPAVSLRRWPRQARRALALAAGLLLMVCLAGEQRTRNLMLPPVREPGASASVSLRASVAEAGSAVVNLTARTADETVGQSRLLVPVVASAPLEDPMNLGPVEAPMKSLFGAGQGVSSGLEPVTNSARRAFGLFLREIPPMNPEAEKPGI